MVFMNIDAQDAQDKEDGRLWRRKHRKEEHAGGTPALPGGTTLPGNISCTFPNFAKALLFQAIGLRRRA